MKLEPDTIYLVESPEDDTVLLALDAKLQDGLVEWFDTSRDRAFEVVSTEDTEESLRVQTEATTYTFRRLTLDLYKLSVASKVVGQQIFGSTAELQAHYRNFVR